jgi:Bacterial PH domain
VRSQPPKPARFRHNASVPIAALVAFLGAVPVATSLIAIDGGTPAYAYPLLAILVVPVLVGIWGWRAGTDADAEGLRLRALVGSRRIAWSHISALAPRGRQVIASLTDGRAIVLPAVSRADLPRLIAASGQPLDTADAQPEPEPTQ